MPREDATEHEWTHWRVKRCCLRGLDISTVVDHLCECCTKDMESVIWKQVGKNLNKEDKLFELMKTLVVKKWNVLLTKVAS